MTPPGEPSIQPVLLPIVNDAMRTNDFIMDAVLAESLTCDKRK